MALEEAAELCLQDQGLVWLGMFEPDEAELTDVQERFGLHDLAVEDAQNFHLRPKIERYEDGGVLFVVLRTARYAEEREEVDMGEVSSGSIFCGEKRRSSTAPSTLCWRRSKRSNAARTSQSATSCLSSSATSTITSSS